MSLFSTSSKRSVGGGFSKLSELSDEEGFEDDFEEDSEDDSEEDSERPRPDRGARAGGDRPAPLSAAGATAPAPPAARCYALSGVTPSLCTRTTAVLLYKYQVARNSSSSGRPTFNLRIS